MKTEKAKLPNTLSGLLRLAVADCKKVEKMKTRKLHMGSWHFLDEDGKCAVCMGGAVMDRTLKLPADEEVWPQDLDDRLCRQLHAIDYMRMGDFYAAAGWLDILATDIQEAALRLAGQLVRPHVGSIGLDKAPWKIYLKAADALEIGGL